MSATKKNTSPDKKGTPLPTNPADQNNPNPELQTNSTSNKKRKIVIITVSSVLFLAMVALIVGFVIGISKMYATEIIVYQSNVMVTTLASGEKMESKVGVFISPTIGVPIPFTLTTIYHPAQTLPSGRLLQQQGSVINSVEYLHKDTQIAVSFDGTLKPEARIPLDTLINFVLQNYPEIKQGALIGITDSIKQQITAKLQAKMDVTVDTKMAYDGLYDPQTNSYKILTESDPYAAEQYQTINPNTQLQILNTVTLKNENDPKQIIAQTTKATLQIVDTITNIVNAHKQNFQAQFPDGLQKPFNANKIGKIVNVAKNCVVNGKIIRCSKQIWQSGILKISNPNYVDPIQIPQIIITPV